MICACGLPARLVADVHRPGVPYHERLFLCSTDCSTVRLPGTTIDVFACLLAAKTAGDVLTIQPVEVL